MKGILLVTLMVTVLLFCGCIGVPISPTVEPSESGNPVIEPLEPNVPIPVEAGDVFVVEPNPKATTAEPITREETVGTTDITLVEDRGIPDLPEGFGIYGASVELAGVYPGWSGTVPLTLVNGNDRERLFVIYAVSPPKPTEGFEALPTEYLYWLTVKNPEVVVSKGETYQVDITLSMPIDADYAGKNAEVRIRVDDTTQTGLVQIALESKWYIITAD